MKLIKSWEDTKYKATNYLYTLPKGTRILHTIDPKTIDTKISIAINAGSHLEHMVSVPEGTAHFLEHILAGDTNKYFKSKKQTDNFEYGNKKRPTVYSNAYTNRKAMYLYAQTNSSHEERASKRVLAMIDFPMELANKKIEKERKIVIAERNEQHKKELSNQIQFLNMLFGDRKPEYINYVVGEVDSIKKVTVDDFSAFFNRYFTRDNLIISVQSSQDISKKLLADLEKMDNAILDSKDSFKVPQENITNDYRYGAFYEPKVQGINVELGFFEPYRKKIYYLEDVTEVLMYRLISKLIFDIMREKKGYVYSSDRFINSWFCFNYDIRGITYTCDPNDLVKSLNELYKIFFTTAEKYVTTKDGERWFDNEMSKLIFPSTVNFDDSYAESKSYAILNDIEIWNHDKAVEAAKKITPQDIINFLKKTIQKRKFYVWLYSSLEKEEAIKMYEKSEIHKHFSV